ncbi:hypothetical protein BC940DRAFT_301644 [Gongronella butleri]|nr:hypothetical protein BC940DRAFT_301644 [Gongronella butleri]
MDFFFLVQLRRWCVCLCRFSAGGACLTSQNAAIIHAGGSFKAADPWHALLINNVHVLADGALPFGTFGYFVAQIGQNRIAWLVPGVIWRHVACLMLFWKGAGQVRENKRNSSVNAPFAE